MKVELEMRGGRWEDHREPFRESFAAVCRSSSKICRSPTQKTFCPPIFGRFPTFADLGGMQNFAVRLRAVSASIFLKQIGDSAFN